MSDIKLNFINQSNDQNNSSVVIFQQNVAIDFGEIAVAWKVIKNCGRNDNHPFVFPIGYTANVNDSFGNFTQQIEAEHGQVYEAKEHPTGLVLDYASTATNANEIQVANQLQAGSINANIYKNGKLLAVKTNVVPAQKAVFEFKPTIWIGVVSEINEGDILNSAIINQINTELSLYGILSADIIMTGGGSKNEPLKFSLENVVMA